MSLANQHRGILFSILSAGLFGCVNTFARISYDAGSNSLTVGVIRSLFGAGLCLALILISKSSLSVSKDQRMGLVFVSMFSACIAICYLSSIRFIPIGLAALLFFTWPVLLVVFFSIRQPASINSLTWLSFLFAFTGIALVIGPVFTALNPFGISLALLAALCGVCVFLFSQKYITSMNPVLAALWVNLLVAVILIFITLMTGAFRMPHSTIGFLALFAASVSYSVGLVMMFLAINSIGAQKSALYFNFEPLVAALIAFILLDEVLSFVQMAGFMVVMMVLFITALSNHQRFEI